MRKSLPKRQGKRRRIRGTFTCSLSLQLQCQGALWHYYCLAFKGRRDLRPLFPYCEANTASEDRKMNADTVTVVGACEDRWQAQNAVDELRRAGFREEQIGLANRAEDG